MDDHAPIHCSTFAHMFGQYGRRRIMIQVFAPAAVLFGLGYWGKAAQPTERPQPYALDSAEVALLQEGDIILRRGSGVVSDMIAKLLDEEYDLSHCGVVVQRDSALYVVHAVSNNISEVDGMQVHRLPEFIRQSKQGSVVVCRLRTTDDRSGIARDALKYLQQAVPFDHHFDLADSSSFYCSELPWHIIRSRYGVDIFQGAAGQEHSHYRFANFMDPELFEIVLDHQKGKAPERPMPSRGF